MFFVGLLLFTGVAGFLWLGVSFMGPPHRCPEHGWSATTLCKECLDNENEFN